MAVGAVVARIISQYSDKGSKAAQKDIAKLGKNIDAFSKKVTKSFAIASLAAGALAVKLGKDAVQGAMADEKQQVALATALRNTTSATEAAIQANTRYLDALELQVAIDNEELIPALQKLATATGNITRAQQLLTLATDVSAASGKDLNAVATALSKAYGGNFTALNKLGLNLDQNAIKAKDFAKITKQLADISKGQAAAAADTFAGKMETLRLRINQSKDTIGYALMPVLEDLATRIELEVIPAVERWIRLNKTELVDGLENAAKLIVTFMEASVSIAGFIKQYETLFKVLGTGILSIIAYFKIAAILGSFDLLIKGIGRALTAISKTGPISIETGKKVTKLSKAMDGLRAISTKIPKALQLTGPTALKGLGLIGVGVTVAYGAYKGLDWLLERSAKADIKRKAQQKIAMQEYANATVQGYDRISDAVTRVKNEEENRNRILAGFKVIEDAVKEANKNAKELAERKAFEAKMRQQELKDLKKQQAIQAGLNKLKALGVKGEIKSDDPIQLEAARLLLLKQNNLVELEKLKRMTEEISLMKVRNDLAKRYEDILTALADNEISSKEVAILSEKWGVTKEAVEAYLTSFFAISDGKIDDSEVIKLAKQWGSTEDQARQYLQFLDALNDGLLSDYEINELKKNWGLTEQQVRQYADFVAVVNDGKLTDAEVIKLMDKWKLTTDQVVDYIKKIGSPVSYSGTLIDPAKAAEIGWLNAAAALQRYLDLLKAGTGTVVNGGTPANPVVPVVPVIPTTPGGFPEVQTPDGIMPSAQAATVYALAKAAGDMETAAKAAAQVNPSALAAGESGAIGAASIAAQLAKAEQEVANAATLAAFKAKEAADAAAAVQAATSRDYDERFRFGLNTVNNASSITPGSTSGSTTVVVNVAGSVTTEQDLVNTVRQGLLTTQYNGNSLLLQAI